MAGTGSLLKATYHSLPCGLRDRLELWRFRLHLLRQNSLSLWKGGGRLRFRQQDGVYLLSDGETKIHLASPWRINRYTKGIAAQLSTLAWVYGYGQVYDVGPGDVVLDVGANIGEFSLFCAQQGAEIYSIEADRKNFPPLVLNSRESTRIKPFNLAVWYEKTTLDFFTAIDTANSSVIRPDLCKDQYKQNAVTLDQFTDLMGIGEIKVIKCDAEGAEPEVLRGAKETLKRTRYVAFDCGFERSGQQTYEECAHILKEANFEIVKLSGSVRQGETLFGRNLKLA